MTQSVVHVDNLSHRYAKDWAVRNVSFSIDKPGVFGLLGANGAGKSTCMNIMCGVLNATEGDVSIKGNSIRKQPKLVKRDLGFLPQQPPLFTEFTVDEYLIHCAALRGLSGVAARAAVDRAKDRCGVAHFSRRLIGALSGGYRQRVGLAQAILHEPSLVVLDEPTNGLDPNQIIAVRALIREIAEECTVLLSTHILPEIGAMCEDIKMIHEGKLVFDGSLQAFREVAPPLGLRVSFAASPPAADIAVLPGVLHVEAIDAQTFHLTIDETADAAGAVVAASAAKGWALRELTPVRASLEEIFGHLSGRPIERPGMTAPQPAAA